MKRFATSILFSAIFIMSHGILNNARANLISDGDFEACADEAGDPISSTCGAWSFANFAAVNNAIGVGPSKGVRLESNGASSTDPTGIQTVGSLVTSATYRLSWDVDFRIDAGGNPASPSFGVFLDNQTFGDALFLLSIPANGYVSRAIDFVATQTTHTFIFAGELDDRSNGAGRTDVSYNLDNVSLDLLQQQTGVPEPGTLALFGIGIAGLGLMRRRRKST